jgi:hypothetical protein
MEDCSWRPASLGKVSARTCLKNKPGVVVHTFIPATQEVEAGRSQFNVNPGKVSIRPLSKKKNK